MLARKDTIYLDSLARNLPEIEGSLNIARLFERSQASFLPAPIFREVASGGGLFVGYVTVSDEEYVGAVRLSKKSARSAAATVAIQALVEQGDWIPEINYTSFFNSLFMGTIFLTMQPY